MNEKKLTELEKQRKRDLHLIKLGTNCFIYIVCISLLFIFLSSIMRLFI